MSSHLGSALLVALSTAVVGCGGSAGAEAPVQTTECSGPACVPATPDAPGTTPPAGNGAPTTGGAPAANDAPPATGAPAPVSAASDSWRTRTPPPIRSRWSGVAAVNGRLYAVDQTPNGSEFGTRLIAYAYDEATDGWSTRSYVVLGEHIEGLAVAGAAGRVHVVGGRREQNGNRIVHSYDPASDSWSETARLPSDRLDLAVAVRAGTLYLLGGTTFPSFTEAANEGVDVLDLSTGAWSSAPPLGSRAKLGAAEVAGRIFAFGGEVVRFDLDRTAETVGTTSELTATGWATRSPMPTPRKELATAAVGGKVYAIGGTGVAGAALATVEEYDPAGDRWTARAPLPSPQAPVTAASLNGKLFALSGCDATGCVPVLFEYSPPAP